MSICHNNVVFRHSLFLYSWWHIARQSIQIALLCLYCKFVYGMAPKCYFLHQLPILQYYLLKNACVFKVAYLFRAYPTKYYVSLSLSLYFLHISTFAKLLLLDLITPVKLNEQYQWRNLLLWNFLRLSTFWNPYVLLSTLFSNTLSICSSLNVRDQVHIRSK
jgi:hypothetical protein